MDLVDLKKKKTKTKNTEYIKDQTFTSYRIKIQEITKIIIFHIYIYILIDLKYPSTFMWIKKLCTGVLIELLTFFWLYIICMHKN